MAAPIIAAIYALIFEVRGDPLDPASMINLLSSTSKAQLFLDQTYVPRPQLAPVSQQGAGLVQAYDAAYASIIPSVYSFPLNDMEHFVGDVNFTLTNVGSEDVTFELGQVGALTFFSYSYNYPFVDSFTSLVTSEDYAKISFQQSSVIVPAGGESVVGLTISYPTRERQRDTASSLHRLHHIEQHEYQLRHSIQRRSRDHEGGAYRGHD
jgi:hypothetical protein